MRFQVNAIFALQTRQGLAFGCAREMDGERMIFQVPAQLTPGERMDFRMQLAGRPEMVTGSVRIESEYPGPAGELPMVEARVVAMSEQNRTLLQSWLIERSASLSRDPAPMGLGVSHNRQRRTESLRSRIRRRHAAGSARQAAEPSSSASPPQGREAITAALKASLKRTNRAQLPAQRPVQSPGQAPPPTLKTASPPAPVAPPPAPAAPPVAAAPQPLRIGTDPAVAIRLGSQPVMIRVRYRTRETFVREHDQHLRGSGLFLPISEVEALKVRGARALVRLDLPSGAVVVCPAEVVAPMTLGVGLALELTGPQRQVLAAEAGLGGPMMP